MRLERNNYFTPDLHTRSRALTVLQSAPVYFTNLRCDKANELR